MRDPLSFDLFANPKRRPFIRRVCTHGKPMRYAVMQREANGFEKTYGQCLSFDDAKALLLRVRQQCH